MISARRDSGIQALSDFGQIVDSVSVSVRQIHSGANDKLTRVIQPVQIGVGVDLLPQDRRRQCDSATAA